MTTAMPTRTIETVESEIVIARSKFFAACNVQRLAYCDLYNAEFAGTGIAHATSNAIASDVLTTRAGRTYSLLCDELTVLFAD